MPSFDRSTEHAVIKFDQPHWPTVQCAVGSDHVPVSARVWPVGHVNSRTLRELFIHCRFLTGYGYVEGKGRGLTGSEADLSAPGMRGFIACPAVSPTLPRDSCLLYCRVAGRGVEPLSGLSSARNRRVVPALCP